MRFVLCNILYPLLILPFARCDQQFLGSKGAEPRRRNATLDDVDSITTVYMTSFGQLPDFQYWYQFRDEFPKEHRRCLRREVEAGLLVDDVHVEVIEAPEPENDGNMTVVAVAAWRRISFPELHEGLVSDDQESTFGFLNFGLNFAKCTHKDLNLTRALDYEVKWKVEKEKLLNSTLGFDQLYLQLLCTHPDFQSRGSGTRLLNAGLEVGKRDGVNVTLIAQSTAASFYAKRGFVAVSNITVDTVDGDDEFTYPVMVHEV